MTEEIHYAVLGRRFFHHRDCCRCVWFHWDRSGRSQHRQNPVFHIPHYFHPYVDCTHRKQAAASASLRRLCQSEA